MSGYEKEALYSLRTLQHHLAEMLQCDDATEIINEGLSRPRNISNDRIILTIMILLTFHQVELLSEKDPVKR